MRKTIFFIGFIISAAFFAAYPSRAWAQAILSLSSPSGTYRVGELFSVLVNVNTGGATVNAATGQLNFDNQRLAVETIGYSRSIFTLWTEEPAFSNAGGTIRFSGGVPNPGFIGASGAIMRITFKPKAAGQAAVVFVSGAVLANDGKGTNIADSLNGGLFTVTAPAEGERTKPKTSITPPASAPPSEPAEREVSAPLLLEWPRQLEEGSVLTISGLGYPNGKILLYIQKGAESPAVEERFVGSDGRFTYHYGKPVVNGFYRLWAKNVTAKEATSPASETIMIEVIKPFFFRIGTLALNYVSIIVTLAALLFLTVFLMGWMWVRFRKFGVLQGKEISEAEKALHLGFDRLKEGLGAYMSYLTETKSSTQIRDREAATRRELKGELKDIEEDIEKEIADIAQVRDKKK